jgi:type II secretory pathway pseudopilin PulG
MKLPKSICAFTLVEVVLAIGVTAFSLTGVMGLLSAAFTTGKASMDDTELVAMANRAVSDLRRQDFTALPGGASVPARTTPTLATASPIFFDSSGQLLSSIGTGTPTQATYRCTETIQADTNSLGSDGSVHLLHVTLTFAWPAQVANPTNARKVYVDIAKH